MTQSKENKVIIDGQTYYGGLNQPNLKFIKVNVDCWEKIFDLLSLRDILAMSGTCQRMQKIGGYYFRENFHGTACEIRGPNVCINKNQVKRDDFLRFVDTINVQDNLEYLFPFSNMGLLSSLTTLRFFSVDLNEHQFRDIENIQTNVETIEINNCFIDDDLFGKLLAMCTKLKSLYLVWIKFKSTAIKADLFQRTYPMLEHLECSLRYHSTLELTSILERNPSIKTLHIGSDDLCKIPHDILTIRLDCLNIEIRSGEAHAVELISRLRELYTNGWYKTLRVSMWGNESQETIINNMASFGALEVLYTLDFNVNICHLTGLKELQLEIPPEEEVDLNQIAVNLINLERLCITGTDDRLFPFLRCSKALKMVILYDKSTDALDLFTMNKMRRMGGMERKVRIGVYERQYLATKWEENNLNYDLVEIIRAETIREHFDYLKRHEDEHEIIEHMTWVDTLQP